MGEMAKGFINGFYCEQCGVTLDGEEPGFTRCCTDCAEDPDIKQMYDGRIIESFSFDKTTK